VKKIIVLISEEWINRWGVELEDGFEYYYPAIDSPEGEEARIKLLNELLDLCDEAWVFYTEGSEALDFAIRYLQLKIPMRKYTRTEMVSKQMMYTLNTWFHYPGSMHLMKLSEEKMLQERSLEEKVRAKKITKRAWFAYAVVMLLANFNLFLAKASQDYSRIGLILQMFVLTSITFVVFSSILHTKRD
jgi:hypothetical protein